ncbi:MAG: phosphoglycolate phosphatase [Burkholderiaceae bacterium]|nr:phosphoglycolate phosphatase [Burkholderiaceae bacterium]
MIEPPIHAVLFDLDGTLADTAPDLAGALNAMRLARGLEPMPLAELRPFASMGARGLIGKGLGVDRDDEAFPELRDEFLGRYEADMVRETRVFDGMHEVLDRLEASGLRWGVVSNKFERYVRQVLAGLDLLERAACVVGGDTTPTPKPHPAPLLLGAQQVGVQAGGCVYVGDDLRDIEAGRAARMRTIAAAYGYCGDASPPHAWGADHVVDTPGSVLEVLRLA